MTPSQPSSQPPRTPRDSDTQTSKKRRRQGQRLSAQEREVAQATFLRTFAISANVTTACRAAGIHRDTFYQWQEHDETFSFRYKQAEAEANDVIRATIFQRAVQGIEKPLHYQGRVVQRKAIDPETGKDRYTDVTTREYSDTLLIFLAKSRMPEFRERQQVDVHANIDIQGAADEADRRFAALLATGAAGRVLGQSGREGES